jgi:hypothetical protein
MEVVMTGTRPYVVLVVVSAFALAPSDKPAETTAGTGAASPGAVSTPSGAAPTDAGATPAQAELTKDVVKNVLASMDDKQVQKIMDGILAGVDVEDKESPEAMKAAVEKMAQSQELAEAVKAYGFEDAAAWADAFKRVLPAMSDAMEKALVEVMGPEAAGKGGEDESDAMKEAFGEPSEADVAVIAEAIKEDMESGEKAAVKSDE